MFGNNNIFAIETQRYLQKSLDFQTEYKLRTATIFLRDRFL